MPYDILNEAEAMDRVFDKELLRELLVEFSEMKELNFDFINQSFINNNLKELEQISHTIKGAAGNLALTGIYKSATALNDSLKLNELEFLNRYFEELKVQIERFREFLPQYLKS